MYIVENITTTHIFAKYKTYYNHIEMFLIQVRADNFPDVMNFTTLSIVSYIHWSVNEQMHHSAHCFYSKANRYSDRKHATQ